MRQVNAKITIPLDGRVRSSGLTGWISWERLVKTFQESGELKPHEVLVQFEADENGIKYIVETDPQ